MFGKADNQANASDQPVTATAETEAPTAPAVPEAAAPVADSAPESAPAPAATAPVAAPATTPDVPVTATNEPVTAPVKEVSNKSKQNSSASRNEADSNQSAGLTAAINASLEEGVQCMNRKKFDCAIGNANTVLRLDPGNARARDMKRKAKEAQDRALSQIEIE
jgi:outer membrane biosynthesis protein TonB